jgi:hypothetical protein
VFTLLIDIKYPTCCLVFKIQVWWSFVANADQAYGITSQDKYMNRAAKDKTLGRFSDVLRRYVDACCRS